jgi:hypothetical protein
LEEGYQAKGKESNKGSTNLENPENGRYFKGILSLENVAQEV